MGLFDGVEPTSDEGSTAEIAKWLGAPVLLVVDASGMARSLAAQTTRPTLLGPAGTRLRGHQFRHSELAPAEPPIDRAYAIRRRYGDRAPMAEGYSVQNVLASYVHAHWASNPDVPRAFVEACRRARR